MPQLNLSDFYKAVFDTNRADAANVLDEYGKLKSHTRTCIWQCINVSSIGTQSCLKMHDVIIWLHMYNRSATFVHKPLR